MHQRNQDSTGCRFEMPLDVTPQMSVFVGGFELTLHSFYTVLTLTRDLRLYVAVFVGTRRLPTLAADDLGELTPACENVRVSRSVPHYAMTNQKPKQLFRIRIAFSSTAVAPQAFDGG